MRKMRLNFRASFPLGSRQGERKEARGRCDSVAAGSGVLCNQITDKPCADVTSTLPHLCADLTDDELTTTVSGKCREREREDISDDELMTSVSRRCGEREKERERRFLHEPIFIFILFSATVQEN